MKNNTINALCMLIIGMLLISIVLPGAMFFVSLMGAIFEPVNDSSGLHTYSELTPLEVNFQPKPDELLNPSNTLTFNEGQDLPVLIHQGIVMVSDEMSHSEFMWIVILSALNCVFFILLIIDFIKFIININKGRIFEKKNFKYLGRFGVYLIIIGLLECAGGLIREYYFSMTGLSLQGYELSSEWTIPWSTFLLGLLSLLLSNVWKVGMNIKEEQQLTI
ncbi:MAG: DUF2975 domain-containing protein [Prevotella sp.]|nr:DUF2975 domain-containing protein [Bacteroides sp.]MCM1366733.1 DUF2975 domain-containing protein [Prevotella sp.]MCM1437029.1 DUF2975 domain-containing protein [Prevotella sp.]